MAQKGTVAPKSRVNIVYKPATEGAQEEIELPFKLLVLGDFTGAADETPLEERKTVDVSKNNFNDVMREQRLNVSINVPDRLSGEPDQELSTKLNFETLKDFTPAEIAKKMPELAKVLELRDALKALTSPFSNVTAFRKKVEAIVTDPEQRERLMKELGLDDEKE